MVRDDDIPWLDLCRYDLLEGDILVVHPRFEGTA